MATQSVAYRKASARSRANKACAVLLRAVMSDDWQPELAARALLDEIHDDPRLLRILRARVSRVMLTRPTGISDRAAATLDCAARTPLARCA